MTISNLFKLTIISTILSGCAHNEIGVMKFPEGKVQHVVRIDNTEWKKCPPHLPEGCELSILEGHPKKPDLFTVRFKVNNNFVMRAHTHPKDERVTIIKGNVSVAFGLNAKHEDAVHFGPGDYYVNARNAIHSVWIDKPAVIQITGIGPWEADFVNEQ